jgi:hypothetical protein
MRLHRITLISFCNFLAASNGRLRPGRPKRYADEMEGSLDDEPPGGRMEDDDDAMFYAEDSDN